MALVAGGAFVAHALAANRNAVTLVRNRIENELLTRKLAKAAELRSLMQGELERIAEDTERENDADALTGAKNRRAFLETVAEHWQRAESGYDPFTLVIIDVDQYDEIHKTHGTDVGNELLKQVSAVIDKGLRTDDSLARLNDSQFAVLLNNALNDGAVICLERIRRKVSAHPFDAGEPLLISVSAGIATWEKGLGMRQLLSRADTSLRRAREDGGNQLSVWGDSLHTIAT
jgi:diguanylate cyclase (GGDEF)-like protein